MDKKNNQNAKAQIIGGIIIGIVSLGVTLFIGDKMGYSPTGEDAEIFWAIFYGLCLLGLVIYGFLTELYKEFSNFS